jgi:hypothetical protein
LRFQQSIARLYQRLQALRGIIEALRQKRRFIMTFDGSAHAQIAVAPGVDTFLQRLQPAGKAPDHRVGSQRNRQSHQAQGRYIADGAHPGRPVRARYVHVQDLAILHLHQKLGAAAELADRQRTMLQ